MRFASDNTSPVPGPVMEALARANTQAGLPYGGDDWTAAAAARLCEVFEAPEAAVHFVATGTAANALSLACLAPPWSAVFCHEGAHIEEDECGAPEFFTGGAKLAGLAGANGKLAPDMLAGAVAATGAGGVHNVQPGAVSLTNATEVGTVYTPDEVAALTAVARAHGLPAHMDGARFANALAATGASPAQMTWKAGVDVLSFGGTKNGLMAGEAVILFDPAKSWELELRRKRAGHLFSKHRYLSAQFAGYLEDGLWLDLAARANRAAARLSAGVAALPGASLLFPTEGNQVFAAFPRAAHRRAHEAGAEYYLWPFTQSLEGPGEEVLSARLVASWSTTDADVDALLDCLRG